MGISVPQTYRLSPESVLKLKLLSSALDISQGKLLDILLDNFWEEKKEQVATVISSQKSNKEARRILEKLRAK